MAIYSVHCAHAVNDVAGERVSYSSCLGKFLGHNFVFGLRTLKPKT